MIEIAMILTTLIAVIRVAAISIKEKYKQLFYIWFLQISHSIFIAYCSKNVYDILAIAVVDWQSF